MIGEDQLEKLFPGKGPELFKYLKKKNRGGRNNAKGNTFENHFAMERIANHFARISDEKATEHIYFSSQLRQFIDDLIIEERPKKYFEYYQLKDVKNMSWNDKEHPVADDFRMQKTICDSDNVTCHLELAVSDEQLASMLVDSMDADVMRYVKVTHFPSGRSVSQLLTKNEQVKKSLTAMCAFPNPHSDQLDTLGAIVIGAWTASTQEQISLSSILQTCNKMNPNFIKGFQNTVSSDLEDTLRLIPAFSFQLEGGYIRWQYNKQDTGIVAYKIGSDEFKQWQSNVISKKPTTFDQIEPLLSL